MKVLQQVCSQCKDKLHRSTQIYKLFLAFLQKMRSGIKRDDFQNIIGNPLYLNAFLCLTTVIFNYAYKTLDITFQESC
jgi:outer membrane protein assembly factor BamE (lipoprotein component of BamABCDE complex)